MPWHLFDTIDSSLFRIVFCFCFIFFFRSVAFAETNADGSSSSRSFVLIIVDDAPIVCNMHSMLTHTPQVINPNSNNAEWNVCKRKIRKTDAMITDMRTHIDIACEFYGRDETRKETKAKCTHKNQMQFARTEFDRMKNRRREREFRTIQNIFVVVWPIFVSSFTFYSVCRVDLIFAP